MKRGVLDRLIADQGGRCAYCGCSVSPGARGEVRVRHGCGLWLVPWGSRRMGQIDHKTPRSRGGSHDLANLVAACARCNSAKSARTPEEFLVRLRDRVARAGDRMDRLSDRLALCSDGWRPYLLRYRAAARADLHNYSEVLLAMEAA